MPSNIHAGTFAALTEGPLVTGTSDSNGGVLLDATGDGTADDVMVFNSGLEHRGYFSERVGSQNEVYLHTGGGTFTELTEGPLVARTSISEGGVVLDATVDGTADDVMVFNSDQSNEIYVHSGDGTFTELTVGPLVAIGRGSGGMLLDAAGDGTADDVMLFHGGTNPTPPNEVYVLQFGEDGLFCAPDTRNLCQPCPAYSIGVFGSGLVCKFCPGGRVGPTSKAGIPIGGWCSDQDYVCGTCEPGKFRGETQATDTCTDCAVGQYASAGASECSVCDTGRITDVNTTAATQCVACPAGKSPNSAQTGCDACGPGNYSAFGVACVECTAGEASNAARTGCVDVDECATANGNCDPFGKKIGNCSTDNGVEVCQTMCQNLAPSYRCGACPAGNIHTELRNNITGQLEGTVCTIPAVEGSGANGASVVPQHTMKMTSVSDTVLEEDHPDRAAFEAALIADLAASLGVDPALIKIKNIRRPTRTRRRAQLQPSQKSAHEGRLRLEDTAIEFDFVIDDGRSAQEQVAAITSELDDPASPLNSGGTLANLTSVISGGMDTTAGVSSAFVCPPGTRLPPTGGSACQRCPVQPVQQYTADGEDCRDCPVNEVQNPEGTGCVCAASYYNATPGLLVCYEGGAGYAASDLQSSEDEKCLPCGTCLVCTSSAVMVAAGFMVSEANRAVATGSASIGLVGPLAVFECPLEGSEANPACSGTQPDGTSMCGAGYLGALCSVCQTGFSKSGDECIDCADASGYGPIITAVVFGLLILLGGVVMSCYSRETEDADKEGGAAKGAAGALQGVAGDSMDAGGDMVESGGGGDQALRLLEGTAGGAMAAAGGGGDLNLVGIGKILTGLFQILSELPAALKLTFPVAFTAVLSAMKVFLLDIFEVFRMGCISPPSVHSKFIVVMLLPLAGIAIVQLLHCIANARAGRGGADAELVAKRKEDNKATAAYRTFFLIFLLYPLLSRTTFHMTPTSCQTLGDGEQWHMGDMSIDCASGTHVAFMALGLVCIIIYPIGIPLVFFFLLRRDTAANAIHPEVGQDTKKQETGKKEDKENEKKSAYDFLKKDYKPEYYYFECITLMEKLLLTGLLVFVDQGSIFQCFVGAVISFAFFAVQVACRPYAQASENLIKAVAEAQLFLTLLLSIVLRVSEDELDKDAFDEDQYGTLLVVAFFSAPAVSAFIIARKAMAFLKARKQADAPKENKSTVEPAPASKPAPKAEPAPEAADGGTLAP
eukprot:SAG22_NODE_413_length_10849_cov_6.078977_7_plen_1231_part_00